MPKDPELLAHLEWLGYLQPVGLVVSPPALLAAQAHVNKNIVPEHRRFLEWVKEVRLPEERELVQAISDFPGFVQNVFGWEAADLAGGLQAGPLPDTLEVTLPDYNESLRPTYAVKEFEPKEGACPWLMLVKSLPVGQPLDEIAAKEDHHWQASPQARFERLLRETRVPTGLLFNGTNLRFVHAPRGESSGHLTFPIKAMSEVAGRPIFAALHMLLCQERLFTLPEKQRLPAILAESRKYQNLVSTRLAGQVLAALYDLLRGFQAADEHRKGVLLRDVLKDDPNHVYKGLLTVLLRLVFLLYAEDRGLLSSDSVFVNYYSITGLFDRLRADAGRYPDTMDQRYGAWAQLLTLFRMIHDGARHGNFHLPPRHGYLFQPDRYCFLEGRAERSQREPGRNIDPPMVADGVLFRVLQNLLILDGERISYRTLDVEQIGSVYETMMGFELEVAKGRSIAINPTKAHGAPVALNLEELLAAAPGNRAKWLKEQTDQTVTGEVLNALKAAQTPEETVAALERKVAKAVTPNIVSAGSMVLQPSDERRRSGSHYTPRSLTEPIVSKALEPILKQLGERPKPEQILGLKVCDPAMGSGAFLVEACRQLGDALVAAWHAHGVKLTIPPDEDEVLHARRLVAQRCLYGVDKNPMAVDLAKLSLWLSTLAKEHPFTFLDHALRCGDSLVGLGREQIRRFHWKPGVKQMLTGQEKIEERLRTATRARQDILEAGDDVPFDLKQQKLAVADESLNLLRFTGNLAVAAFFAGANDRRRETRREDLLARLTEYLTKRDIRLRPSDAEKSLLAGPKGILPFHWEIEFPEVFGRDNGGFDCIVGNPPFLGGSRISSSFGPHYLDWLLSLHQESHGNGDLVAHFFRRAFKLLRQLGCFGLIATNTIGQGDTRTTGLQWICSQMGRIYNGRRRRRWPGQAAVIVSEVHICKGEPSSPVMLDDRPVERITAYLLNAGGNDSPIRLSENAGRSYTGVKVYGAGFLFDDGDTSGLASPLSERERLIAKNRRNADRIFPYIGGAEFNDDPRQSFSRYVINFEEMTEEEARRWPDLVSILEEKVKPERAHVKRDHCRNTWWQFEHWRAELQEAIKGLDRVLANSEVGSNLAFGFLPTDWIFAHTLKLFTLTSFASFCSMQCRVHEVWARCFASSMKDDLRYTPSDCFETFPFPPTFETNSALEEGGREYYEFRAALMVKNNEGLTKTYNRFHDPNERSPDIFRLRELHAAMDRAVLDAYGWTNLNPTCEFLLDYEEEEDEEEGSGIRSQGPARRRKKPWRYRWPDDFRDIVLARLLELNKQRAEEERLAGAAAEAKEKKAKRGNKKKAAVRKNGLFQE
jgi:hypothetical protein